MSAPDNENIQGVKDVFSWFIDQNTSSDKKSYNTEKPDYSVSPDPPSPTPGSKSPLNSRSFKEKIKISWEESLDECQLEHWEKLSAGQQGEYFFTRTEIGKFMRGIKRKKECHYSCKKQNQFHREVGLHKIDFDIT
ncbi:hypothetical protein N9413_08890 [Paracoccaceae bacterium]|jgi:hypothetical protein|nr:hypothetical protein [Paracoccaceae bacterium]